MRTIGSAQPSGGALPSSVCDEHRPDRQLLVDLQLVTGATAVVGGILLAAARWVVARSQFRIDPGQGGPGFAESVLSM